LASAPVSGAAWRAGAITARAPNTSAERRTAPTLCGSVTRSAAPRASGPRRAELVERPQSSGFTSSAAPWCTEPGSSGAGKRRGSAISGSIPAAAMASPSRSAAFGSRSAAAARAGFSSASRTACRPNSHTVSAAAARRARSLSITQAGFFRETLPAEGDELQGAAADCNSAGETHAWFDSRVAHHLPDARTTARLAATSRRSGAS
jgi:hypothetical protein